MSNEYIIFYGYTFTDKRVRRNLAPPADERVLLNFDECSNFGFIADRAAIKVDQVWLEDLHSMAQDYIGGNWHEEELRTIEKEQNARYKRIKRASTEESRVLAKLNRIPNHRLALLLR